MKTILRAVILITTLLTWSPFAYAAAPNSGGQNSGPGDAGSGSPGGTSGNPRMACREDAHNFCKGIQPGGGRIKDCLEDHYKELSDACYTALKNGPPGLPPYGDGQAGNGSGNGPPPQSGGQEGMEVGNGPQPHDDPGPPPDDSQ